MPLSGFCGRSRFAVSISGPAAFEDMETGRCRSSTTAPPWWMTFLRLALFAAHRGTRRRPSVPRWTPISRMNFLLHLLLAELKTGLDTGAGAPGAVGPAREGMAGDPPLIAGYEILRELGRGGMGVVYHAQQLSLGREVALKVVLAGAHAGWSERSRFRVEAETAARLKHPNIVAIYDVGEQNGLPYVALELVEGGSLAEGLARSPLAPASAAGLAETLARAIEHVHQHGIVHRDLKPANVLMTAEGVPKITDFGLAKWVDVPSGHTQSGAIMGTPSYMAPEQARGEAKLTGTATDVYALGSILYEMVTGRPPFKGATAQETVHQLLTEDPVPPTRLQPQMSRDLETICLRCLQKEPSRRYAGAGALADDLRRYLDGKPIQARPTPSWERVFKWTRRHPGAAMVLAVSALAAVVLVASSFAYNGRLRRERAIAQAQRDAARMAQRQSEADFRLALDAVQRFYTEVSENKLLNVPTMDTLRIELLERARDFYQRIAQERPDDPDVQAGWARAGWRLAVMVSDARSIPEGISLLAQPIGIQERLAERYPDRPEYRSDLARSYNNLGIMHRRNNQNDLGGEDWERALALRDQLVREQPDNFLFRRDLGQTRLNLGNWYRTEKQWERAEESYRSAFRSSAAWRRKRQIPHAHGPTCPSRRSPWTPIAFATTSRSRTLTWQFCFAISGGPPNRPTDLTRRSIAWTGWFASSQSGAFTGIFWPRPTTSAGSCWKAAGRSAARPSRGQRPGSWSRCLSASIPIPGRTDTSWHLTCGA